MHTGICPPRRAVGNGPTTRVFVALLIACGTPAALARDASFHRDVQPLLRKYCLDCHSTKAKKGSLDLERFATEADIRKEIKPWQGMIEQLEADEMPPKKKPQPSPEEKERILGWVRGFLDAEARARSGDPGLVPLRRLSNAEYDATVRDLIGVDLRPAREFPADGAAGEGFTNAAEALSDMSPTLLNKYLAAAKEIADHAVLLPQGFRFSPSKTRRDWTNENTALMRRFYAALAPPDGRLVIDPYLHATIRHRDALKSGKTTITEVAAKEKLNARYLGILWKTLTDQDASIPLTAIRQHWQTATEKDAPAVLGEIVTWQNALWKISKIGNYYRVSPQGTYVESLSRQFAGDPTAVESLPLRPAVNPSPGQSVITLLLATRDLLPTDSNSKVVWSRPRFEGPGQAPLLLKDYRKSSAGFEVDYPSVFAKSAKYLGAVAEAARDPKGSVDELAKKDGLDSAFLRRWVELLNLDPDRAGRLVPLVPLETFGEKIEKSGGNTWINGWRNKGRELPTILSNSSDTVEHIPGDALPHHMVVHPTPADFVGVVWKSPVAGKVNVSAQVKHAHAGCGNSVAWWLEHRHNPTAFVFAEGLLNVGGKVETAPRTLTVAKGDEILLAIDAKKDHGCDLTDIGLTVTSLDDSTRSWVLAKDVADTILEGNPHKGNTGEVDTWTFVKGPTRPVNSSSQTVIPNDSLLTRWRAAAVDPKQKPLAESLAAQVQSLLSGPRPTQDKSPDRQLYDNLVTPASVLFQGLNVAGLGKPLPDAGSFGWPDDRFGADGASVCAANSVTELRLPASLFHGREFVVDGKLESPDGRRVVQFQVALDRAWKNDPAVVAMPGGPGFAELKKGTEEFRGIFPLFLCYPNVVPTDEVVTLKMFHREDDSLIKLFLNEEQTARINTLWRDHRFISRQPVAENAYLPQFIGFVTQDQPKEMVTYFENQRPAFKKRADDFIKEYAATSANDLDELLDFASKAFRRPLRSVETSELKTLYQTIRKKGADHEESVRGVLTRILIAPSFLFRIESAPPGKPPARVNDWELATRLSYFLWSSMPDDELRKLATAGQLHEPKVLTAQMQRMLADSRVRSLAVEFGTQWIHVRGFDDLKEKNERLFPTFDAGLKQAIHEESIRFFQDLFQGDRRVTDVLNADATFLNEALAKHYGIPGVTGPEWRRVEGVKKYGRGGVLGLASVQTKQAGASRTSPILRGNWVVETLLGEKLPRPPANVPLLPEVEGADKLTMRQLVEKHTSVAECAVCHVRIDPFGYALEKYDPIGRLREKDLSGMAVDVKSRIKDGTEFEGIDGLRDYLLTKKKDVVVRLFCKRLVGYALGRSVTLSDTFLLDAMVSELNKNDGRVTAALRAIVLSPQFTMVRGREFEDGS